MTQYNLDQLTNEQIRSKLACDVSVVELVVGSLPMKVVVANGVPIPLGTFTLLVSLYACGDASLPTDNIEDSLGVFWDSVDYHPPLTTDLPPYQFMATKPRNRFCRHNIFETQLVGGNKDNVNLLPLLKEVTAKVRELTSKSLPLFDVVS